MAASSAWYAPCRPRRARRSWASDAAETLAVSRVAFRRRAVRGLPHRVDSRSPPRPLPARRRHASTWSALEFPGRGPRHFAEDLDLRLEHDAEALVDAAARLGHQS